MKDANHTGSLGNKEIEGAKKEKKKTEQNRVHDAFSPSSLSSQRRNEGLFAT
jgi:hypothetical protein